MRNGWSAAALGFRSGPGAQYTALQVHCNDSCLSCRPDGKLRTSACAVIPHLQAIGPLQSQVCLLLCLMHPAPRATIAAFFFFAHSVAIGHDAFRNTREKDFVVIQKELVSRSLSEDAFATVRSSFLPASCAPSFPSSPFPSSPLQPRHRRNRHTTPTPPTDTKVNNHQPCRPTPPSKRRPPRPPP